jgi:hypothetical protein
MPFLLHSTKNKQNHLFTNCHAIYASSHIQQLSEQIVISHIFSELYAVDVCEIASLCFDNYFQVFVWIIMRLVWQVLENPIMKV